MKNTFKYVLLLAGMTSLPAMAHIGYGANAPTGRDFGTFSTVGDTATRTNSAATGNFGWVDGTDGNWGDSHKLRAYRFTLTDELDVSITFKGDTYSTATTSVTNALTPGFSLYKGLAHGSTGTGGQADHDGAPGSVYIRERDSGGVGLTEGSFRTLGDWSITNNSWTYEGGVWVDGPTVANPGKTGPDGPGILPESFFQYIGHAYDGTIGGISGGDGVSDGSVTHIFHLLAGDYSIFVGGTDFTQDTGFNSWGPGGDATYGVLGIVSVVPEPETYAMLLAGLGLLGFSARRRRD